MAYFILFTVILALCVGASDRGCGIKCFSFSCQHNKGGRCGRRETAVYDNTIIGMCLYHTDGMATRVVEPSKKIRILERGEVNRETIDKITRAQEEKLLKDPNAFAKWMERLIKR